MDKNIAVKGCKPTLLVLAAGMGSRYKGLKQLDRFGPSGETIMDYSVYDAIRAGFGKVVFVIRKDMEQAFEENVASKYRDKIEVRIAFQESSDLPSGSFALNPLREKPLGTGHAVWCARGEITEPFAVINADDFYGREAYLKIADFLKGLDSGDISTQGLVGYILKNTLSENGDVSRGVCDTTPEGELETITERTKIYCKEGQVRYLENGEEYPLSGEETVSMNLMGFTPAAFEYFEKDLIEFLKEKGQDLKAEFYLPTVLGNLSWRKISRVKVLKTDSCWFGVTYPEDKALVVEKINRLVEEKEYPQKLW